MRVNITLACTECGERNYISTKNKRNNPDRVEFKSIAHVTKINITPRNKVSSRDFPAVFLF